MKEIKSGDKDKAVDSILNDCTPALNKAVKIATRLDEMTDEVSSQAVRITVISAVAGIVCIIICLVLAWKLAIKTGKKVLESILVPLQIIKSTVQIQSWNHDYNRRNRDRDSRISDPIFNHSCQESGC